MSVVLHCQRLKSVKRRLELLGTIGGIKVYDDFAHHQTAIQTTLEGLRANMTAAGETGRLLAVIEARSNTMKMGYHQQTLASSFDAADAVLWYKSTVTKLDLDAIVADAKARVYEHDGYRFHDCVACCKCAAW